MRAAAAASVSSPQCPLRAGCVEPRAAFTRGRTLGYDDQSMRVSGFDTPLMLNFGCCECLRVCRVDYSARVRPGLGEPEKPGGPTTRTSVALIPVSTRRRRASPRREVRSAER